MVSTVKNIRTIQAARELKIASPEKFIELARRAGIVPTKFQRSFVWSATDIEAVRKFIQHQGGRF